MVRVLPALVLAAALSAAGIAHAAAPDVPGNVEWSSARRPGVPDRAITILARDRGHPQARLVRQRLDAAGRPWTAKATT